MKRELLHTSRMSRASYLVACVTVVLTTGCAKNDTAAETMSKDATASTPPAPQIVDVGAEPAVPDSERATGTVIVSAAKPAAGDGGVQITRRAAIQLPGAASAFALEGMSGAMEHSFLVVFDSSGAVTVVTHKWHNADNSVVAQTDCGSRTKCSPRQVGGNAKSGTVVFTRLVLTGLDGNTAQEATSTLNGAVP
jgi:hypothetical protein